MKAYASLFVAWVAFASAGCCHGNKNQCCQPYESYGHPVQSSCSSCNSGHVHGGPVHGGVISSGPIHAPTPVPMGEYEVAPTPPAELPQ